MVTYVAKIPPPHAKPLKSKSKPEGPLYVSEAKLQKKKAAQQHQKVLEKDPILRLYEHPIAVTLPWYVKYFFIGLYLFFVIVIFLMLNALLIYQTKRKWWNSNGGKKYHSVFSINLLAQYRTFALGYYAWALFVPVNAKVPGPGAAEFIVNLISAFAKLTKEDNDQYFMLPVHVCENIAVGTLTTDQQNQYKAYSWSKEAQDAGLADADFAFNPDPPFNGWPSGEAGWKKLLYIWGVPSSNGEKRGDSGTLDINAWEVDDNFLFSKYRLPGDTQFIYSFMWGTAEAPDSSTLWYPEAFSRCVGLNMTTVENVDYSGGWWGFLKYGLGTENDVALGLIMNYLYAQQTYTLPNSTCGGGQIGVAVAGSAMAGAGAAFGILPFVSGPVGVLGMVVAGLMATGGTLLGGLKGCGTLPG